MEFRQPHHIKAEALGGVDLFHRFVEHLRLTASRHRRKLVEHAEFHVLTLNFTLSPRRKSRTRNLCTRA
jgi:hypothetical protein